MPKDPRFNAAAVATWWQDNLYSGQAVIARYEPQACNGFPIRSFPQRIFLHPLLGEKKKPDPLPLGYPCHRFGAGVFSFQTPRELIQALEPMGITVVESRPLDAERLYFEGESGMNIARNESTRIMHALLRDGFERRCLAAGLTNYELAGERGAFGSPRAFVRGTRWNFQTSSRRRPIAGWWGRASCWLGMARSNKAVMPCQLTTHELVSRRGNPRDRHRNHRRWKCEASFAVARLAQAGARSCSDDPYGSGSQWYESQTTDANRDTRNACQAGDCVRRTACTGRFERRDS